MTILLEMAAKAKTAAVELALYDTATKNKGLEAIAEALAARKGEILAANAEDIANAESNNMRASLFDRLRLTEGRINDIVAGVRQVMQLEDPIGEVLEQFTRPNGMEIVKQRVPLGVIGIIYEARPNVTVDAAVLCLKSGNAAFLRGGKEAFQSNLKLMQIMQDALEEAGLNRNCLSLLTDTSRDTAQQMMRLNGYIDVLIPRGGAGLINSVLENASVPVIETGTGNCHLFVDESADLPMAVEILMNGKCQRPSVCNALETVLVHEKVAAAFLPVAKQRLDECNVEWRGCPAVQAILPGITAATEADFEQEFGDFILAAKVVADLDEAISHISKYSTHHSECIVTTDQANANRFTAAIDAAAVYVNVSTRFTDGGEFGRGAEIGISTQKMHARGPMGLSELTSYKYIIRGSGQIR